MPKQPPYEPVRPVSTDRAGNARRYMGNMAKAANSGMLASETLVGLQRPSQGLPEGVPAMVLRCDSEGVWYAAEWSEPDAVSVATPPPRVATQPESVATASLRSEGVATLSKDEAAAERKRRYREEHRAEIAAKARERRARERGE